MALLRVQNTGRCRRSRQLALPLLGPLSPAFVGVEGAVESEGGVCVELGKAGFRFRDLRTPLRLPGGLPALTFEGPGLTTRRVSRSSLSARRFPCSRFFTFSFSARSFHVAVPSTPEAPPTPGVSAVSIAASAFVSSL